ncbi:MAG: stage II sporulation protein M [Cellulomonas sp.]|uniref:Membrane protein n=1 Tax=Cellulomonas gelida TaxID=1712 RepID=A0A4Y3KG91_9CELL|nr:MULTISPECIES: stage II sporulation protein M [Cellulomonas]KMM46249.1 membrane protein [Cellulomonas sp. A375-1]MCR6647990.1 stage II sporulation protein M [Cellulomonas sp.]MCR6703924.1 stage II sporulation protein M [Cellulomonas sp.]GEA83491.1 membrane protein [Cellulomonas gelida]GGL24538.1 membrane protein [Cellulomonas gelida]
MDLDAYQAVHSASWQRLDELIRTRRRTGAEADELVRLYQAAATDLSTIRSAAPDPETVTRLSQLVARARAAIAGTHEPSWRDAVRFVVVTVPAAFYRLRWWTVAVMVAFLAVAVVAGVWVATNPDALAAMGTPAEQREYVDNAFASYYDPGIGFAATVWTHNALLAALCVGTGVTGIGPVYFLWSNAVAIGNIGGMMAAHDALDVFLTLIAPHGLLELTAVFVAGAAGLKVFWAWLAPGPRTRGRALAQEARALFTAAIGLVGVLALSGLVEGFVTGSGLVWWVKIVIGALALAAFWAYTLVLGGRAVRAGATGDLEDDRAGYALATAG